MFIINIIAFIIITLLIAKNTEKKMVDILHLSLAFLVLILYIFAFFKVLLWIDYLGIGILLGTVLYLIFQRKTDRKELISLYAKKLTEPSFLVYLLLCILMIFAVRNKLTTWWDDYNYWSSDAKSLYYLSGFAGKYANVSPEFGDYPPALSLIKWWFLHMNPREFDEGLMFAGYYFSLLTVMAPFLGFMEKKSRWALIPGTILLIFFPCVAEAFWCDGACADLLMAMIYGLFLIKISRLFIPEIFGKFSADSSPEAQDRSLVEISVMLSLMMLCKTTAVLWIVFGFVYFVICYRMAKCGGGFKGFIKTLVNIYLLPMLIYSSWYGFCLINRRISHLTSNSLKMATGSMNLPGLRKELLDAYVEGFVKWPLHRYFNGLINLSPLMFIIILLIAVICLGKFGGLEKKYTIFISIFGVFSGMIFYGINLISHLTIFATEDQYLDPFAMVSSMERYGSPYTFGMMMLVFAIILRRPKMRWGIVGIAAFILLTTDYESTYRAFVSYNEKTETVLSERQSMVTQENEYLISGLTLDEKIGSGRVLYIRDAKDYSKIRDTYVSFMASPLPIVYTYRDVKTVTAGDLIALAKEYHAECVYFEGELYNVSALMQ